MKKIFIVEDEEKIREELSIYLEKWGYSCITSTDFNEIAEKILDSDANIVLLDINLPKYDGYQVCRQLREKSEIPIIIVTSRNSQLDELMSMNLGADDFITKPYHLPILLARIEAVLKRVYKTMPSFYYQGLEVDLGQSKMCYHTKEIELTKNELKILICLIRQAGTIVSRDKLMQELWQSELFIDDNTLTVNVNRLRKKMESINAGQMLKTKRGQGYLLL